MRSKCNSHLRERGIVADYATSWVNGNVGQQRLYATEQRVSLAGEQPSVVTRVAAAREAPDETMKQALAGSSAKEACAASNTKGVLAASSTMTAFAASDARRTRWVEKKPVLLIGSLMCCITMMKSQNVVERHVRRS